MRDDDATDDYDKVGMNDDNDDANNTKIKA